MLTLEAATERALEQSLTLKKSAVDLEIARIADKNLWAEVFPSISAGASMRYNSSATNPPDEVEPSYGLSASLSLQLNAGLPAAMKIIRLAYKSKLLDYENSRRQLSFAVTKQFYTLLKDKNNLIILREKLKQTELQLQNDRVRFNNGMLNELSYERSQFSVETAKLDLNRAESSFQEALGEFLVTLGYDQNLEAELEGSIEVKKLLFDPEKLIDQYLPGRPDILAMRQTIERLTLLEKQKTLSARAPSLSLSANWSGTPSQKKDFSDSVSAGVSLSIPIESWVPGSKTDQSIKSASKDIEKAQIDLEITERDAKRNVRALTESLRNSWSSIEIARLRVQMADRAFDMAQRGFRQGTVTFLELETARNGASEARQQLLTEELSYKTTSLDLAAALNAELKDVQSY
ncbi:membrane protein [Spirochaetia bacterium]|nr:membrane protein [Spirochaetia bacterium]